LFLEARLAGRRRRLLEDLTDSCSLINPENDMGISQPAKSTNFALDSTYFE
jgi:hypothetical protein